VQKSPWDKALNAIRSLARIELHLHQKQQRIGRRSTPAGQSGESTPARRKSRREDCPAALDSDKAADQAIGRSPERNSQMGRRSSNLPCQGSTTSATPRSREGGNLSAENCAGPTKRR
jgi:hypothetical protein